MEVLLKGEVEIDETYIGGLEKNKHGSKKRNKGRGVAGKVCISGMREKGGRTRAKVIRNRESETLSREIKENIAEGSIIYTDEHRGYRGLSDREFEHKTVDHWAKEFVNTMASTNGVESVWAVLKGGYKGVYHNWNKKHLKKYIDEFSFRLNEGNVKTDTQDQLDALFRNMAGKTITFEELTQ